MTGILVIDATNYRNSFKRYYVKNAEHFLEFLLLFQNLGKIFLILKKKNWIYRLYIPEVIDPAKRGYFNTR